MAKQPQQKRVTKKHLARAEREARLQRNILIGTGVVLAIVIGLIVLGLVLDNVINPQQPVATVDGTEITTDEFQKRVSYRRSQLVDQYTNTVVSLSQFGSDPNTVAFMSNTLNQIDSQLENATFLGQDILDQLIQEELIRQEAEARGITVTKAEIDQTLEEALGFFPEGQPTAAASQEPRPTSTLTAAQRELVTPLPTQEVSPTAAAEPTSDAPGEGEETTVPTATPFTREAFEIQLQQIVSTYAEIGFNESDLRNLVAIQLLQEKVLEAVTADTSSTQEQVWARHILVEDEETAQDILGRLDGGEDWTDLAAELSIDQSNAESAGDLGWFSPGQMVSEFEAAAFSLEIGETSEPVETQFGWHIIQVIGHEDRTISDFELNQIRQQTFLEWVEDLRGGAVIVIVDGWELRVPTEPSIPIQARLTADQLIGQTMQPADPAAPIDEGGTP